MARLRRDVQKVYPRANDLGLLTLTVQSSAGKSSWAYDEVGNRTKQVAPSRTTNYTYDADNRMLTAGSKTLTYDHNGNRLTESESSGETTYSYDANEPSHYSATRRKYRCVGAILLLLSL
jgi:YD repeat-containing protein